MIHAQQRAERASGVSLLISREWALVNTEGAATDWECW